MKEENQNGMVEPSRTFPIKRYGNSYVLILDRQFREMLKITQKDVDDGLIGIRAKDIKKVYLYKTLEKFGGTANGKEKTS